MHASVPWTSRQSGPRPWPEGRRNGDWQRTPFFNAEISDLLERFAHSAFDVSGELLEAPRPPNQPETVLDRCLAYVGGQFLQTRNLQGTVNVEPALPGLYVPEGPLRSLLEHLVEGSLRGNASSRPYVHIGVSKETDDEVTLYLRDNGTSIPECTFEEIREFIRTHAVETVPDRVYRLFLADNLVQWIGGHLWVGATHGEGTTIFLRLPKKAGQTRAGQGLVGRHVF
jgi:K+-sensing histidine kinase KdpD